jgi:aminoglycoside phosphotransferase family enzyme
MLPELVRALLDPEIYPEAVDGVELIQTQMSFVFLAGDFVYKVKKPVNLGYLDYSTLEKRQALCQKELTLNRRLCPQVYLDVVAITNKDSRISIDGPGEVVEYAVKMRRLPEDRMMNVLLVKGQVTAPMLKNVAAKLAVFHQEAATSPEISAFGSLDVVIRNTEENFTQTGKNVGLTISPEMFRSIQDYTRNFIQQNASLFQQRVAEGRIRDCHGDLHAAHICFAGGICIYDCIEFNDRFRYGDVASEIAFLAMDLDHYGKPELSGSFVDAYVAAGGDKELLNLLNFYKCYRAYVRGKVEGFKLNDPYISAEEKAKVLGIARRYFELAESYIIK